MRISTNTFSDNTPPKSTNQFAAKTIETGSDTPVDKEIARGTQHGWEGDNVTDAEMIESLYTAPHAGVGEAGGIAHFKNRPTPPEITHT